MAWKLITTNNAKINKSLEWGYLSGGLHLAPASLSGRNVCPHSSAGCRAACLNTAGHGRYTRTQLARKKKTEFFISQRHEFMRQLISEISQFRKRALNKGLIPVFRPNLTSDIVWERISYNGKTIFEHFPDVQFMDYTKIAARMMPNYSLPANYHLTFSRSEENEAVTELVVASGKNVAVVFDKQDLPPYYYGVPVFNGDISDLRFLDPKGVIVGLYAKERAKRDKTGFVVNTDAI